MIETKEEVITIIKEKFPDAEIRDLEPCQVGCKVKGEKLQLRITFLNGFTGSLIRHGGSYGASQGLFELAVMVDGHLTYTTHITDDVLGHLDFGDVLGYLTEIACME